ncbi:hypothetical protein I1A62_36990 [Rhodococcus sp. USK10]|uniref:hypothetical protein n=1 Tax=Rhodococcus sp. USK10 TaxID=2789739 RepID=UPI001C5E8DFD|nr:hypothetical protein [Rhodococcus sp. USK10]QYB02733.1 hypothetical protein I1A62_36990 [Rhodococcus sp. USK10]
MNEWDERWVWTSEEIAAMDARAEQLDAALRDVQRFTSPAQMLCPQNDRLRIKLAWILKDHRSRMAVCPVIVDGVLGGLDGTATCGNPNAKYLAPRGSDFLPEYDPDDPGQRNTPLIVLAWEPDHEWIVRSPYTIEDLLNGFTVPSPYECNWHNGCCRPDHQSSWERSLLVLTRGQFLVLLLVCAGCREKMDCDYGGGLHWWPVRMDNEPSTGGFDPYQGI